MSENPNIIKIATKSKLLESKYGTVDSVPNELSEHDAYELMREINESKKGKAVISEGKLIIKDLIVG